MTTPLLRLHSVRAQFALQSSPVDSQCSSGLGDVSVFLSEYALDVITLHVCEADSAGLVRRRRQHGFSSVSENAGGNHASQELTVHGVGDREEGGAAKHVE